MLKVFTIVSVDNDTNKAGTKVLNTDFFSEVKTINTTQARFKFNEQPDNRRGKLANYIVTASRAEIVSAINSSINADAITLSVYPNNDSSQTAVPTVFRAPEIIQCYPTTTRSDRTKSWIEVNEKGTGVKKYLIAHYFIDVVDYVVTGSSTTTSTTSTSTTSTSSTTT